MSQMSQFDKNFIIKTSIDRPDVRFYSIDDERISLHGVFYENGKYRRMPENVASSVSKGIAYSHSMTTGGRVRFKTNSPYVAISVRYGAIERATNFSLLGTAGFDLYETMDGKQTYVGAFIPPIDVMDTFESVLDLKTSETHELTLNLPLYSEIKELYIGISEHASLESCSPYKHTLPIVYYGSSITHGACASRPGNSYPAMISRELDTDFINLGFGGNAKGEENMARYVAGLEMSAFVYDYDHNSPSPEYLEATHEAMFRIIREARPTVPIICLSRPKKKLSNREIERLHIIETTYKKAVAIGDRFVSFVPGSELVDDFASESCRVDDAHPNDLGFFFMAKRIGEELKKFLQ